MQSHRLLRSPSRWHLLSLSNKSRRAGLALPTKLGACLGRDGQSRAGHLVPDLRIGFRVPDPSLARIGLSAERIGLSQKGAKTGK